MSKLRHYFDLGVYLIHRTWWNLMACFGHIHGIVLMYHYITDEHVGTLPSCVHTPAIFESTLNRLKDEGYEFVSVTEMLEIVRKKENRKFAVITFDDIMDDVYTNAYPILKRLQIPFTLFVASGLIDTKDYVTTQHLKEMDKDMLCTVGAHTINHVSLRKVTNSKEEIEGSKRQLEFLLGHKVDYMAYPYGWHCDVSRKEILDVKKAGYICAFGTIQSPVSEFSARNNYYLPRMVMMK